MKKRVLITTLTLILVTLTGIYTYLKISQPTLSQKAMGGDFTLPSTKGEFKLQDYRGKIVILYFGYLFCPDICPTTLSTLSAVFKNLSLTDAKNVQIIFISVDPERDTLEKIKNYVEYFDASIIGATDSPGHIKKIANLYGVAYKKHFPKNGKSFYVVDHSTQAFLIDKKGVLAKYIQHGESAEKIQTYIQQYLKD